MPSNNFQTPPVTLPRGVAAGMVDTNAWQAAIPLENGYLNYPGLTQQYFEYPRTNYGETAWMLQGGAVAMVANTTPDAAKYRREKKKPSYIKNFFKL